MLSKIWCVASCGQFVHLYHLFCMKSNAIFHFYCSLYLLISGALIEFNLFDPSRCSVVRFTGLAAIWEALPPNGELQNSSVWNTEMSKIMISYRLKYNRYRYFSITGIPRIPNSQWPWLATMRIYQRFYSMPHADFFFFPSLTQITASIWDKRRGKDD